jgi:Zn-finger nucleic acid-binding protein
MTEKPSQSEEEYFARKEAELLKARRAAADAAREDAERKSHFMKCPKCGADLQVEQYEGIEVDRCTECQGVWFDAGEVEQLLEQGKREGIGFSTLESIVQALRGRKREPAAE